jgi:ribosomal protein S18 acetylase RimI-like enzyme
MIVERATLAEAREILDLQKLAYRSEAEIYGVYDIPPLTQSLAEMQVELEEQLVLKAVEEGRIVGSVRAYLQDGTCHIGRLIVHPSYQNRGIGTRLMGEVEGRFDQATRYELFTGHRSERNLYLYRKPGYRPFQKEEISTELTLVYLEKRRERS